MKQVLFVDDERMVLNGLERQFHGMASEWQMKFVESGPKALEFMGMSSVDIIVTDMMMPGMDGAQLLTEVRTRHPNTVRLVLSGHADREAALRLVGPAHQYLCKPCSTQELRGAITRAFALRDLLSNEQVKRLATRLSSLPVLPSLHLQLTTELGEENPSLELISGVISRDIGMTTKILQLVNSAFFGLPQPLTQIDEAVQYLGLATVHASVLSLQIFSQYNQPGIKGFSLEELARHCWQVGVTARKIAQLEHAGSRLTDQCFLAGLLHDVGHLILASNLPEQSSRMFERARKDNVTICESERTEFGATHAEVGAYLLALWGLPAPVVEAVCFHHQPADCVPGGFSVPIAVHVANTFALDLMNRHPEWPGNQISMDCLAKSGLESRLNLWKTQCQADQTN